MMRLTTLLLCLILAAAAAGRYKAESAVRDSRAELRRLDREKSATISEIQLLRAEVAYLESPERLAAIADRATDLEPLSGAQLLTADDFELAFGANAAARNAATTAENAEPIEVAGLDGGQAR